MKVLAFAGLLVLGSSSIASAHSEQMMAGSFAGRGHWKSAEGKSGTYTVSLAIAAAGDNAYQATSTYTYAGEAEGEETTRSYTLVADFGSAESDFFTVSIDGKAAGEGYCFKRVCHYSFRQGDVLIDEAIAFTGKVSIYRTGTESSAERSRIAWEENFHRIKE